MKIPWRIKIALADFFPRPYYLLNNILSQTNLEKNWDRFLKENWDNPKFDWPTKNELFANYFPKNAKIIDIGFGTGTSLKFLSSQGFKKLWGYEHSSFALMMIADSNIKTVRGSLPRLNLQDNSFDGFILSEVLEHILRRKYLLCEMKRILKHEGKGIITVPDNRMGPEEIKSHTFKYSEKSLKKLLTKFFIVERICSIIDINHCDPTLVAFISK